MGIFNWWLTHGPGSPGSIAKTITLDYNKFRKEFPGQSEDEILKMTFTNRLIAEVSMGLPDIVESDSNEILDQVIGGDLKKLVAFFVHRENPEADKVMVKQPKVYSSMIDVISKVIKKYQIKNLEIISNRQGNHDATISQSGHSRSLTRLFSSVSNSFTNDEKDIFNSWAGLPEGQWDDDHKRIFSNTILNHLYDGKSGKIPLPPSLKANAKFLKEKPEKPIKPITDEIRKFLNSLF